MCYNMNDKYTARVGSFYEGYEIYVFYKDPSIEPCFHILYDGNNICSVSLIEPRLILVGNTDKVNNNMIKRLIAFLGYPMHKSNYTNWNFICDCWDSNNEGREVDDFTYSNIPNYIMICPNSSVG